MASVRHAKKRYPHQESGTHVARSHHSLEVCQKLQALQKKTVVWPFIPWHKPHFRFITRSTRKNFILHSFFTTSLSLIESKSALAVHLCLSDSSFVLFQAPIVPTTEATSFLTASVFQFSNSCVLRATAAAVFITFPGMRISFLVRLFTSQSVLDAHKNIQLRSFFF